MADNIRKIFDMLGVEPNEKFKIKYSRNIAEDTIYYIEKNLRIRSQGNNSYYDEYLSQLLTGEYTIIKLPKKKKLRDLTPREFMKWEDHNCQYLCEEDCNKCPFQNIKCDSSSKTCWFYHKELYSDKFLDQEVEVPE